MSLLCSIHFLWNTNFHVFPVWKGDLSKGVLLKNVGYIDSYLVLFLPLLICLLSATFSPHGAFIPVVTKIGHFCLHYIYLSVWNQPTIRLFAWAFPVWYVLYTSLWWTCDCELCTYLLYSGIVTHSRNLAANHKWNGHVLTICQTLSDTVCLTSHLTPPPPSVCTWSWFLVYC